MARVGYQKIGEKIAVEECCKICINDPNCIGWSGDLDTGFCYLARSQPCNNDLFFQAFSGIVHCPGGSNCAA